jgi:hypothetical protein
MEDQDLKNIWQKADRKAVEYYVGIAPEILTKAKKGSHDILARVRKNIIIELWLSAITTVTFPFLLLNNWIVLVTGTLLIGWAMIATLRVYLGYLKQMKAVNEENLLDALSKKVAILSGWVKRVKWMIYFFSTLGYFFGMFIAIAEDGFEMRDWGNPKEILIEATVTLLFLGVFLWLCDRYVHWMYGKKLKKLREILNGLRAEHSNT